MEEPKESTPEQGKKCGVCCDNFWWDLFLWKSLITSGIVFGSGLVLIYLLTKGGMSILSLLALLGLCFLLFQIVRYPVIGMFVKTKQANDPWKLEAEEKTILCYGKWIVKYINKVVSFTHCVYMFKCGMTTVKVLAGLVALFYIGKWFSGMTIIVLVFLGCFSLPLLYTKKKEEIRQIMKIVHEHFLKYVDSWSAQGKEEVKKVLTLLKGHYGSLIKRVKEIQERAKDKATEKTTPPKAKEEEETPEKEEGEEGSDKPHVE